MINASIITPAGYTIEADVSDVSDRMPADGFRVAISQDGHRVGSARWTGGQIADIDARLGAADGSETEEAYRALDAAISAVMDAAEAEDARLAAPVTEHWDGSSID